MPMRTEHWARLLSDVTLGMSHPEKKADTAAAGCNFSVIFGCHTLDATARNWGERGDGREETGERRRERGDGRAEMGERR